MSSEDRTISFDLTGTVAVVTGAAQGIGQAVAVALAQMGADVACVDRDAERQAETVAGVEAHGRRALAIGGDVTDREGVQAASERVVAELGPIGALVCAAGVITENVPAEQVREADLDLLWAVNVKGSFHWAVAASHSMERPARVASCSWPHRRRWSRCRARRATRRPRARSPR